MSNYLSDAAIERYYRRIIPSTLTALLGAVGLISAGGQVLSAAESRPPQATTQNFSSNPLTMPDLPTNRSWVDCRSKYRQDWALVTLRAGEPATAILGMVDTWHAEPAHPTINDGVKVAYDGTHLNVTPMYGESFTLDNPTAIATTVGLQGEHWVQAGPLDEGRTIGVEVNCTNESWSRHFVTR